MFSLSPLNVAAPPLAFTAAVPLSTAEPVGSLPIAIVIAAELLPTRLPSASCTSIPKSGIATSTTVFAGCVWKTTRAALPGCSVIVPLVPEIGELISVAVTVHCPALCSVTLKVWFPASVPGLNV